MLMAAILAQKYLGWQWPDPGKRIHSPGAH
jgi:hypothetical protein